VGAARLDVGERRVDLADDFEPVLLPLVTGDERRKSKRDEVVGEKLAGEVHGRAAAPPAEASDDLVFAGECAGEGFPDGVFDHPWMTDNG